jgi:hypothetical protein
MDAGAHVEQAPAWLAQRPKRAELLAASASAKRWPLVMLRIYLPLLQDPAAGWQAGSVSARVSRWWL